jgi:hypothetical protein
VRARHADEPVADEAARLAHGEGLRIGRRRRRGLLVVRDELPLEGGRIIVR